MRLELYTVLGQRVELLYDDAAEANVAQTVRLRAANLASGVYFARFSTANASQTIRMLRSGPGCIG